MRALILLCALLVSCNASRQLSKSEQSESASSGREMITVQPGDTLSWVVKDTTVYRYQFKDTIITRVSQNNTVLRVKYDSTGQVDRVDCITPELLQYLKEWNNSQREDKQKETESKLRTIDWFYLAVIAAIFLLLLIKLPSFKVK